MRPQSNYKLYFYTKFSLSILPLLIPDDDLIRPKNVPCMILKIYEVEVLLTVLLLHKCHNEMCKLKFNSRNNH